MSKTYNELSDQDLIAKCGKEIKKAHEMLYNVSMAMAWGFLYVIASTRMMQ